MEIFFYKVNDEYGCFSNFSPHCFEWDGQIWNTSEHYCQAQKFVGTDYAEQIRLLVSPMEATKMGRDRNLPLRKDWEDIKDEVMKKRSSKKVYYA